MPIKDLKAISAIWRTPPSNDIWNRLKNLGDSEPGFTDYLRLGPTLPTAEETRTATLSVHRCTDDELHWALTVRPAPTTDAPEQLKAGDQKLGGRNGLATLLAEALPIGLPDVGAFRVRFHVPEATFVCHALPVVIEKNSGHEAALRFGRKALLEQVGYRFEGGAGGIEEIALIYLHKKNQYSVILDANGPLKFTSNTWLPFADDVGDLALNAFFSPREVET